MSVKEKIEQVEYKIEEIRELKERKAKELAEKNKINMMAVGKEYNNYIKRALEYCNNIGLSFGIYEGMNTIAKKMETKSSVRIRNSDSSPDRFSGKKYIGKKCEVDGQTRGDVINVNILHKERQYGDDWQVKLEGYSKDITDFSIIYYFDNNSNPHCAFFRYDNYHPVKFEVKFVDLSNGKYDLKREEREYDWLNFEKKNVSTEDIKEISDTILANMYLGSKTDPYRNTEKQKEIFSTIVDGFNA